MLNKIYSLILVGLIVVGINANATTYTAIASGDWNDDATWSGSGTPGNGDIAEISGFAITVTANVSGFTLNIDGNATATSVTVNSGITFDVLRMNLLSSGSNQTVSIINNGTMYYRAVSLIQANTSETNFTVNLSGTGTTESIQQLRLFYNASGMVVNIGSAHILRNLLYMYGSGTLTTNLSSTLTINNTGALFFQQTSGSSSDNVFDMDNSNAIINWNGGLGFANVGGEIHNGSNKGKCNFSSLSRVSSDSRVTYGDVEMTSSNTLTGDLTFGGDMTGTFTVPTSTTLTTNGNDVNLPGSLDVIGTLTMTAGDVLSMNGSSAQTITSTSDLSIPVLDISNTSGGVSITGSSNVEITEGVTFTAAAATAFTTGAKLILKTGTSGMANIGDLNSHSVSGDVTCEYRSGTLSNIEYRHITMPVSGITIGDIDYDASSCSECFYSYGFTGANTVSSGGVASSYTYNTANITSTGNAANDFAAGWSASGSDGEDLDPRIAMTWYIGPGSGSFSRSDYSFDVSGTINSGPFAINGVNSNLDFNGTDDEDSWALVGNPFPSTVDFSAVTLVNVGASAYQFKPDGGGYSVDNTIPPFQAFFVKASGASPTITFEEADKLTTQKVYQKNIQNEDEIRIKLTPNQYPTKFNYTYINFRNGTSNNFEQGVDLEPLGNPYPYANLSGKTNDGKKTYRYVTDPDQGHISIPLNAFAHVSGNYELAFSNLDKIDGCIILEDNIQNTFTSLNEFDSTLSFNLDVTLTSARFTLHIYNFKEEINVKNSGCFGENKGVAELRLHDNGGFIGLLYNSKDKLLETHTDIDTTQIFENLAPGNYRIELTPNSLSCSPMKEYFTIHEPSEIKTNFGFANQLLSFRTNNEIEFKNLSTGGIAGYMWDFGDGETSTEMNPKHSYLEAGVYDIILTSENGNPDCNVSHKQSIEVAEATNLAELSNSTSYQLVYNNGNYWVHFNRASNYDFSYRVFDIQGKELSNGNIETGTLVEQLDVNGTGILLISLNYNDEIETIKIHR